MYVVIAALLGAAALIWLGVAMFTVRRRASVPFSQPVSGQGSRLDSKADWSASVADQTSVQTGTRYRPRPTGTGPRWNPYATDQSSRHRVRADRRRSRVVVNATTENMAPYRLLGVSPTATPEEIERAYRRHAAKIHPDRFHGDPVRQAQAEEKLKELNATMQILRAGRRAH